MTREKLYGAIRKVAEARKIQDSVSEEYIAGFSKAAEECGVDPQALMKVAAGGSIGVQALLRMVLPKAQSLRRLISRNAYVNRTPLSMLTRAGREATLRDTGESASFLARILPKDSPAHARNMREAFDIQLLRQMNGNKRALTDTVAKQLDAQQTPGKAYNLINALVGRKLKAPK